jgi:hypothetical protein
MTSDFALLNAGTETAPDGFILYTKEPFYLGRITKWKEQFLYLKKVADLQDAIAYSTITGYAITIEFAGTLDKRKASVGTNFFSMIEDIMKRMADFYYEQKIKDKPGMFKKYKL